MECTDTGKLKHSRGKPVTLYSHVTVSNNASNPASLTLNPLQWALVLTLRLLMSHIYIYDINDLTLILLTWRKW